MPTLPSGKEIRLSYEPLEDLLYRRSGDERDRELESLHTVGDLLPYLRLLRYYEDLSQAPRALVPVREVVADSDLMPGFLTEPLDCTLADWIDRVDWSDDDRAAFAAYLSDIEGSELLGAWLKRVIERQGQLARERSVPRSASVPASAPDPEAMARYEAGRLEAEAKMRRLDGLIPFRVDDLLCHDYGLAEIDIQSRERLHVGGSTCWIRSICKYATYSDTLCGRPNAPESDLRWVVKRVETLHPEFPGRPFIVPPLLRKGAPAEHMPWVMLPPVTVIAAVGDGTREAIVVWFQDRFDQPLSNTVMTELASMDWTKYSVEWDP
jgi:hypothetical protein